MYAYRKIRHKIRRVKQRRALIESGKRGPTERDVEKVIKELVAINKSGKISHPSDKFDRTKINRIVAKFSQIM